MAGCGGKVPHPGYLPDTVPTQPHLPYPTWLHTYPALSTQTYIPVLLTLPTFPTLGTQVRRLVPGRIGTLSGYQPYLTLLLIPTCSYRSLSALIGTYPTNTRKIHLPTLGTYPPYTIIPCHTLSYLNILPIPLSLR